jgi:hypothetical protein
MSEQTKIDDGGPAFPQPNHIVDTDRGREEARGWMQDSGMTLRDWFAGQALAGLLASSENNMPFYVVAPLAYRHADAMLKARGGAK